MRGVEVALALALLACGPSGKNACERSGGHLVSEGCTESGRVEYHGGKCGWSLTYCEGARPYHVTKITCERTTCVYPVRYAPPREPVDLPPRLIPGMSGPGWM